MAGGGASEILALEEFGGGSLAPEQRLLTPFQRFVILLEAERQQEEAQKQQELGNRQPNSAHGMMTGAGSSKIQGETVEYVNEGLQEDD